MNYVTQKENEKTDAELRLRIKLLQSGYATKWTYDVIRALINSLICWICSYVLGRDVFETATKQVFCLVLQQTEPSPKTYWITGILMDGECVRNKVINYNVCKSLEP